MDDFIAFSNNSVADYNSHNLSVCYGLDVGLYNLKYNTLTELFDDKLSLTEFCARIMADRGRRHRARTVAPYDLSLPENWTITRLRSELDAAHVSYSLSAKKKQLINLYKQNVPGHSSGSESTSRAGALQNESESESRTTMMSVLQTVKSLSETVSKLQSNVSTLTERLNRQTPIVTDTNTNTRNTLSNTERTNRLAPAAAAGSEAQLLNSTNNSSPNLIPTSTVTNNFNNNTEYTLSSAFNAQSLPGTYLYTKTKFGYSAESLPYIETISPNLRKAIVEGKDVNLAQLIIPSNNAISHISPSEKEKDKEKDPRLLKNLTLGEFITAFGIYKNIMCQTYPHRREELDLYERDIVDMATRYGGKGFYEYHKSFSATAAAHLRYNNVPVDWSVRNNKLFCNIFANLKPISCYSCGNLDHTAGFCPMSTANQIQRKRLQGTTLYNTEKDTHGRVRQTHMGREICNNFNNRGCTSSRCGNSHICLICKGEHSAVNCKESKNGLHPHSKN